AYTGQSNGLEHIRQSKLEYEPILRLHKRTHDRPEQGCLIVSEIGESFNSAGTRGWTQVRSSVSSFVDDNRNFCIDTTGLAAHQSWRQLRLLDSSLDGVVDHRIVTPYFLGGDVSFLADRRFDASGRLGSNLRDHESWELRICPGF